MSINLFESVANKIASMDSFSVEKEKHMIKAGFSSSLMARETDIATFLEATEDVIIPSGLSLTSIEVKDNKLTVSSNGGYSKLIYNRGSRLIFISSGRVRPDDILVRIFVKAVREEAYRGYDGVCTLERSTHPISYHQWEHVYIDLLPCVSGVTNHDYGYWTEAVKVRSWVEKDGSMIYHVPVTDEIAYQMVRDSNGHYASRRLEGDVIEDLHGKIPMLIGATINGAILFNRCVNRWWRP